MKEMLYAIRIERFISNLKFGFRLSGFSTICCFNDSVIWVSSHGSNIYIDDIEKTLGVRYNNHIHIKIINYLKLQNYNSVNIKIYKSLPLNGFREINLDEYERDTR